MKEITLEKTKKAYDEVLEVLRKNKKICNFDVKYLERKAKIHLFALKLKEVYRLNITPKEVNCLEYIHFGDKSIGLYGEKYRRTISWSADGKQPTDEYLFVLNISRGAYIFGNDYPEDFFQKFWLELKSYKPDYIDEVNNRLYWKLENAKDAFNNYDSILEKYYKLNKEDIKRRRIKKMKKELEKLESSI